MSYKLRHIPFRRDMQEAIDARLKTQTRRPVKHPGTRGKRVARFMPSVDPNYWIEQYDNGDPLKWTSNGASIKCPYGCAGDRFVILGRTYEIIAVRINRVQDISENDAAHEGFQWRPSKTGATIASNRAMFKAAWDSIYGKTFSWASNPFCWVLTFRRIDLLP